MSGGADPNPSSARWMVAHALILGPVPVTEGIDRCRELVLIQGVEIPGVLLGIALFAAMECRFDEARELTDRARRHLTSVHAGRWTAGTEAIPT